jgi:lysophospholipase
VDEPAPLFGTTEAPVPAGARAAWFAGAGGERLRGALFPVRGAARGSVIVSPGRTEPIEKYFETVETLRDRGFAVVVHDWRGQGLSHRLLSDRLLGHASGYTDFLGDYGALIASFEREAPEPWIALGHSMGGCLTLLAMARGETRFAGAILSAPMLGLQTGAVPRRLGRIMAAALSWCGQAGRSVQSGSSALPTPFEANVVTHDRARYERNEAQIAAFPDLALGPPTWGWLDFAFSATVFLARDSSVTRVVTPVTVVAAGEDHLVDNAALRRTTARLPDSRLVEIPGAYHEILQETDRVQAIFWREFDDLAVRAGIQ